MIYEFIEKQGGVEAVKTEFRRQGMSECEFIAHPVICLLLNLRLEA